MTDKDIFERVAKKMFDKGENTYMSIEMPDGSTFELKNPYKFKALKMKMERDDVNIEQVKEIIREETKEHWENRTVPTKHGSPRSWENQIHYRLYMDKCEELRAERQEELEEKYGMFIDTIGPKGESLKDIATGEILEKNEEEGWAKVDRNGKTAYIARNDSRIGQKFMDSSYMSEADKWADKQMEKDEYKDKVGNLYEDMAELARNVFYMQIRGFLMGIILSEETDGSSSALLMGNDEITEVKDDGFITREGDNDEKM